MQINREKAIGNKEVGVIQAYYVENLKWRLLQLNILESRIIRRHRFYVMQNNFSRWSLRQTNFLSFWWLYGSTEHGYSTLKRNRINYVAVVSGVKIVYRSWC